jgi:hypothetical protein
MHQRRPKGKEEMAVKPSNITNIINNNNINNYIINDPNKAPEFINSHSQFNDSQALASRVQTADPNFQRDRLGFGNDSQKVSSSAGG